MITMWPHHSLRQMPRGFWVPFIGCRILGVMSTSRLFHCFYYLKSCKEFYFLQSRDSLTVTKLLDTNKDWKPLFVRVIDLNGFGVNL